MYQYFNSWKPVWHKIQNSGAELKTIESDKTGLAFMILQYFIEFYLKIFFQICFIVFKWNMFL